MVSDKEYGMFLGYKSVHFEPLNVVAPANNRVSKRGPVAIIFNEPLEVPNDFWDAHSTLKCTTKCITAVSIWSESLIDVAKSRKTRLGVQTRIRTMCK